MTARTAIASTVHEPVGKPGGPGLWGHKGWQLPAYIQHVANELRKNGKTESHAIAMAVGIIKNWAHGHDGRGNSVSPAVQAAAAKALAQWQALKARTHSHSGSDAGRMIDVDLAVPARELTAAKRKQRAGSGVAMPDGSFPIFNEQSLRSAITSVGRAKDPAAAKAHIVRRAKALGLARLLPDKWRVDAIHAKVGAGRG